MASINLHRLPRSLIILSALLVPQVSSALPPFTPVDFRYSVYSDTAAELFWNRTTNVSMRPGDDGDWQAGLAWPDPRFRVNVNLEDDLNADGVCNGNETCNGTVTDILTGLVWLQNANCFGERSWSDAIDDANGLAGDGTSSCCLQDNSRIGDWRLPNIKELHSLMDYGHVFPTFLLPAGHPFYGVQTGVINELPAEYWTSTSTGPGDDGASGRNRARGRRPPHASAFRAWTLP